MRCHVCCSLEGNSLSPKGAEHLAAGLKENSVLHSLKCASQSTSNTVSTP